MSDLFQNKRKLFGTILGLIIFFITMVSLSYAFYSWRSSDTNVTFSIDDSYFYCETDLDSSINSLGPTNDYKTGGSYQQFTVNNIGRRDTTFSLSMNITSMDDVLKDESFKYVLLLDNTGGNKDCTTDSSCTVVGEGNFKNAKVGMNTLISSINLPNNTRYAYWFFMYIDGGMNNPTGIQNASMVSSLGVCDIIVYFDTSVGDTTVTPLYKKVSEGGTYGELPWADGDNPTLVRNDTIVSYDTNGGSAVSSGTITYTFNGWYFDNDTFVNQVSSSTLVSMTTNHTIYPKWTNSGAVTLPATSRDGYDFEGWYSDSELTDKVGEADDSYSPEKSITLHAKWTAKNYNIAYELNNGTFGTNHPDTGTYGTSFVIDNPTKTLTFVGNSNSTPEAHADGATIGGNKTKKQTFAGWTSSVSAGLGSNAKRGTSSANTAWNGSATTNRYFMNLRDTEGTVTMTANWTAVAGTLPTVTKVGYTCGWNTSSTGTTVMYASGASFPASAITENMDTTVNLYAVCVPNEYTLTFDANGGTVSQTTKQVSYGVTYNDLPTPTRDGYQFAGWYATFNGSSGSINYGRDYEYTDAISVHMSVYREAGSSIIDAYTSASASGGMGGFNTDTSANGKVILQAYDSGIGKKTAAGSTKWSDLSGEWHDFDIIFDGTNAKLYIDGSLNATSAAFLSGSISYNPAKSMFVGPGTFSGYIGNIIINHDSNLISGDTYNTITAPAQNLTLYAKWIDITGPTVEDIAGGTTTKATSQDVTLKCTDNVGVTGYYWGTTEPTSASAITTTTAADLTALASNNGLSKEVDASGTYWLACKDADGNFSKKSVTIAGYTVYNMRDKLAGNSGTYTTGNYDTVSTNNYLIKEGSYKASTLYTVPGTIDTQVIYDGYASVAPSTTNATLVTTAASSTNVTIANGGKYSFWFNRKTYPVNLVMGNGISSVSGAGTYKWGASVSIDAVLSSGYTWKNWTVGDTTTVFTTTKNHTFTMGTVGVSYKANATDTTDPTVTLDTTNNLKATTQTATLKCSDNVAVTAYYWGTTEPTAVSAITTTTAAKLASLTSSSGLSETINSAGTYWLACKDAAGNYAKESVTIYSYEVYNLLNTATDESYSTDNYGVLSHYTYLAQNGTELPLNQIYTVPSGSTANKFKGYSVGTPSANVVTPLNTPTPTLNENSVYSMWFGANAIYFRYHVQNDETFTPINSSTYTWNLDGNNFVRRTVVSSSESSINFQKYKIYGNATLNLYNYNSDSNWNITKGGYKAVSGSEWICFNGCATANFIIGQQSYDKPNIATICPSIVSDDCYVDLKVNWEVDTFTITLNGNGATSNSNPTSLSVDYNSSTLDPSTITLPKQQFTVSYNANSTGITMPSSSTVSSTFDGWYTGENDGSLLLSNTTTPVLQSSVNGYTDATGKWIRTSDATAYAHWTNDCVTLPTLSKAGYACKWAEGSASGTQYDAGICRPVTANRTYYAKCSENAKTITIKKDNAAWSGSNMKISLSTSDSTNTDTFSTTASGSSVTFSSNGTSNIVEGTTYYIWMGKDSNHKTDMVYSGVSFVGKDSTTPIVNYYTLTVIGSNVGTLKVNNSSVTSGGTVVVASGYAHAITGTANTGYSFSSWSKTGGSGTVTFGSETTITTTATVTVNSATITASAIANGYNINYELNNGTHGDNHPVSGSVGTAVQISNPTKTLTFVGHTNSTNGANGANVTIINNNTTSSQTFAGWTSSSNAGLGSSAKTGTTSNPSTTWNGSATTNQYFKDLRSSSGTVTMTANWTAVAGTLPSVTKDGYTCGWGTSSNSTTITYESGGTYPTSAITNNMSTTIDLYAVCNIDNPNTPTITPDSTTKIYGASDTTLTCSSSSSYASGVSLYYEFGWSSTNDGSITWMGSPSTTSTKSISSTFHDGDRYFHCRVYANDGNSSTNVVASNPTSAALIRHNNATITFNANGGVLSGTSPLYTRKNATTLYSGIRNSTPASVPTASQEGYTFNGWYTAATNGSKVLNADGTFTGTAVSGYTSATAWDITSNKTLYAHYSIDQHTLTINPNGGKYEGSSSIQTFTQNYGTTKVIGNITENASYTVTYNDNGQGATYTTSATNTVAYREFDDWNHTGGGSYSSGTYTYGTSDGTLTAGYANSGTIKLPNDLGKDYSSCMWAEGSPSGTQYAPGSTVTISANTTFYAACTDNDSYTATFYYNSNATAGSATVATETASCTLANGESTCTVTIPNAVKNSVGTWNNAYAGLSTGRNMTQSVASGVNTVTLSANASYYSIYSSNVNIYGPSDESTSVLQQYYRNDWFTTDSALKGAVLSTSPTGTTNFPPAVVDGYTFSSLRTEVNNGGTSYTVANAATTTITTFYVTETKNASVTATFYYNSNTTAGSITQASTSASGNGVRTLYCTSTSEAAANQGNATVTIPEVVRNSVGQWNTPYHGLASTFNTMNVMVASNATTVTVSNTSVYYAIYSNDVSIYGPTSEEETGLQNYHRNEFFTNTGGTTMNTVLSTSATGTTNNNPNVVSGYTFGSLRPAVNNGGTSYTVAAAATTAINTFYVTETKAETLTATFYYNSNTTSGEFTSSTSTASGDGTKTLYPTSTSAAATSQGNANVTIPNEVKSSVGKYNTPYHGLANTFNTMNVAVASNVNTVTINNNSSVFYAIYSDDVSVYRPSSESATTLQGYHRNEFFTSASAMSTVLSTSTTGTTNETPAVVDGYTFSSLRTAANNGGTPYTVTAAANTDITTFYVTETKNISMSATFYYNSNATAGSATPNSVSNTGNGTKSLYPTSTSAATTVQGPASITIPDVVKNSVGTWNNAYGGLASEVNTLSTVASSTTNSVSVTSSGNEYFAIYQSPVTYYYYLNFWEEATFYRNDWFVSKTALNGAVLSNSATGTTNYEKRNGPRADAKSVWIGLSTDQNLSAEYNSVAAAAATTGTTFYTIYRFTVIYEMGDNVVAIGKETDTCDITYDATSCNVVLPSITPAPGYTVLGWKYGRIYHEVEELFDVDLNPTVVTARVESAQVPTCTLNATGTSVTLHGTDNTGIKSYYWGTTAPTSSSTYTPITPTDDFSTIKDVTAAGTYYFSTKDDDDQVCLTTASIEYVSYTVHTYLQNIGGSDHTSTDYTEVGSSSTNLVLADSTINLSTGHIPSGSNLNRYEGYTTTAPSSTNVTPTLSDVTISENSTYYLWFKRNMLFIKSNSNGGTWENTDSTTLGTDVNGWLTSLDGTQCISDTGVGDPGCVYASRRYYGGGAVNSSAGLTDWNNSDFASWSKDFNTAEYQSEWCTNADGTGTCFNQADASLTVDNLANAISCDLSTSDCIVNLYINWRPTKLYIQYNGNATNVHWGGTNPIFAMDSEKYAINTQKSVPRYYNEKDYTSNSTLYNTADGLSNWDNADYIKFTRLGYAANETHEWCATTNGTGTCFDDNNKTYTLGDLAAVGKNLRNGSISSTTCDTHYDCVVTLYVNWQQKLWSVSSPEGGADSLNAAASMADAGATLVLQKTGESDGVAATLSKNLTINNNGKSYTFTSTITVGSGKTVTMNGAGTMTVAQKCITNNGTLNISAGTYKKTSTGDFITNAGTFKITGGTFLQQGTSSYLVNTGTATIASATFTQSAAGKVLDNRSGGSLTISSGTYSQGGAANMLWNAGNLTVTNGTFTATGNGCYFYNNGGTTNLNGGSWSRTNAYLLIDNRGTLSVSNGTYESWSTGPQILQNNSGTATLSGGTFKTYSNDTSVVYNIATLLIKGAKIYNSNSANDGVGVSHQGGTLTMSSGTLSGGTGGGGGSGLYISSDESYAKATVSGGSITGVSGIKINNASGWLTVTGGTITHNATTTGQGRPIWMSSSVSVGANKGAQVRITGGTFTSGLTGDPAIQVGIASDTARMHGVLYITGGKFTTNSGSNNGIIVYSKDKWPTTQTDGYLNYCGMGDTVHIGGSAQFTNNSTNADKCVLFASDGSYIHTPASYTGYVYSKNGYGICATDSGSKIAFNGGTIYAKNTSLFKRATNGATVTIGSSATTSVGAP